MPNNDLFNTETPDPVELTRSLVRCPSVTPEEGGALELLSKLLTNAGFHCRRVDRNGVANLYARWGAAEPVFGFNGHTDVVPPGDAAAWRADPFSAEMVDGDWILGRGAVDMKSGVAAFASAAIDVVRNHEPDGSIVLAITGDEEGDAVDGTAALLDWMEEQGEKLDICLVGEPTSRETIGDMIKIGRRGSMTAFFTARGRQGHSAYPHAAVNPLPPLVRLLNALCSEPLDEGNAHFEASTLAITTVDVGNPATNVIPAEARATVNIRYNNQHNAISLENWLKAKIAEILAEADEPALSIDMTKKASGDAFLTPPGGLSELISDAIVDVTGRRPELSTSGGTSDARFIKNHCPVVECGLVGKTMHQVDERVYAPDVRTLTDIYRTALIRYFGL